MGEVKLHYSVIVIGAGQAGLSMSYWLQQQDIDHLVLEKNSEVAVPWKHQRWDTFCLVTPNWQCQLPGYPYRGIDPDGFMVKDEIVAYLEGYYKFVNPKVLFNSPVIAVNRPAGIFHVKTPHDSFTADNIVLACGGYHHPFILPCAAEMPATVEHVHSSEYRGPQQLPEGEVMVVGTGQSGAQIAEDLHLAGRKVHLCVGNAPRVNRRYRGKDVVNWLEEMGYYETTIDTHPEGANAPRATNHYVTGRDGGHDINLRVFAREGMALYGHLEDVNSGVIAFADDLEQNLDYADEVAKRIVDAIEDYIVKNGIEAPADDNIVSDFMPPQTSHLDMNASGIRSVVWATGFKMDFGWIKLPVTDERGYPLHKRGVSPEDGLYFLGLNWMHTWGSGRFYHVGRDAEFLCAQIVERQQQKACA